MSETQDQNRQRILDATETLLRKAGRDALTVRAVAHTAGVQLPTIYRLFTDKVGLLEAVVERGFLRYMTIEPAPGPNPSNVDLLRHGWSIHVRFGIENPELYSLMYGDFSMRKDSPALRAAKQGLEGVFDRLAQAGQLKVSRDEAQFFAFSSASGTVLALQFLSPTVDSDAILASVRETMIDVVTVRENTETEVPVKKALAIMEGNLSSMTALTLNEQGLLGEWLVRVRESLRQTSGLLS